MGIQSARLGLLREAVVDGRRRALRNLAARDVESARCGRCSAQRRHSRTPRSPKSIARTVSQGQHPSTLAAAISYVEAQFRTKVTSAKAASLCGLSAFQFSRVFKETYAITFQEYLLRFRIREACRLLKNPAAQVADVAHLVGFNDPSYFCRIFKRYTAVSPSHFSAATDATLDVSQLLGGIEAE